MHHVVKAGLESRDARAIERAEDLPPMAPRRHNAGVTQDTHVPRHQRLRDAQDHAQICDRALAHAAQLVHDVKSGLVSESLEVSPELLITHGSPRVAIHKSRFHKHQYIYNAMALLLSTDLAT